MLISSLLLFINDLFVQRRVIKLHWTPQKSDNCRWELSNSVGEGYHRAIAFAFAQTMYKNYCQPEHK